MADDRNISEQDTTLDPEDVNSPPSSAAETSASAGDVAAADPNDEVPVPIAMSPAEVDERAQAIEALRRTSTSRQPDSRLEG